MYARDSITYKEHVLVYINGIISRKAKITNTACFLIPNIAASCILLNPEGFFL